ncbi:flavodoxin [Dehalococcoides mccartyi]|uniref:Flavodoxin n=1 Tax=Dehalococcoides mccartyi TaxID=61435 RepID=A0A2J1DX32_9CHLR|nr:flavodoxin [Dehalococcoides mccartyi]
MIKNLPTLKGIKVASFDTRFSNPIVKIFGFAADRIAASLTQKGGQLLAPPTWFFVETEKGPLKEGELERAAAWAKELIK